MGHTSYYATLPFRDINEQVNTSKLGKQLLHAQLRTETQKTIEFPETVTAEFAQIRTTPCLEASSIA